MDNAASVVGFALAALAGGAGGLRIESLNYVRAVRMATTAPIIGIVKQDRADSPVRITPTLELATRLCDAGADIVAFDATRRVRPVAVPELVAAIKARGRLTMADCSDLEDARAALAAGVDLVGSTMSGYTGGPEPTGPDFALLRAMRELTPHVVAEGRIHAPAQAAEALRSGAFCVVVGSALTRTEHATGWFKAAIDAAARPPEPTLAIDIGGTKIMTALVGGDRVEGAVTFATVASDGPDAWLAEVAERTRGWRYARVAAAVTGLVDGGAWSALNPATLRLPEAYPLASRLQSVFGVPAIAANDAQAAAWGEYSYGAGAREDMVFLTISTGVGGGVVLGGRPLLGLAGHFGQQRLPSAGGSPLEDAVSGRWIAAQAKAGGRDVTAVDVFAAADAGATWANDIITAAARSVALLCGDIQLTFDPRRIVMGGGIGLAPGFLDRVRSQLSEVPVRRRPALVPAQLGVHAGLIGVAALDAALA